MSFNITKNPTLDHSLIIAENVMEAELIVENELDAIMVDSAIEAENTIVSESNEDSTFDTEINEEITDADMQTACENYEDDDVISSDSELTDMEMLCICEKSNNTECNNLSCTQCHTTTDYIFEDM